MSGAGWADEIRIAALGDSLTQGYGLVEQDGFVPQLQNWLARNGAEDVVLVNAGVSGDTTAGGLARIGWTLDPDTDGLIVALGANDMLRGIDPAVSRQNLTGIMDAAREAGMPVLLVGVEAAGNFGPDYKRDFDAMYPALADDYDALLFPNFFAPLLEAAENGGTAEQLMQPDRLHPSREGVAVVIEAIGPSVAELAARIRAGA